MNFFNNILFTFHLLSKTKYLSFFSQVPKRSYCRLLSSSYWKWYIIFFFRLYYIILTETNAFLSLIFSKTVSLSWHEWHGNILTTGFSIFKTFLRHGKKRGLVVLGEFIVLSTKDINKWKIGWAHPNGFFENTWNKQVRLKFLINQRSKRSGDIIL